MHQIAGKRLESGTEGSDARSLGLTVEGWGGVGWGCQPSPDGVGEGPSTRSRYPLSLCRSLGQEAAAEPGSMWQIEDLMGTNSGSGEPLSPPTPTSHHRAAEVWGRQEPAPSLNSTVAALEASQT